MLILTPRNKAQLGRPNVVALFGRGLIGGAIVARLLRCGWTCAPQPAFSWTDVSTQTEQLRTIKARLLHLARSAPGRGRLDIVWSAGRAGFAADWPQLLAEEATLMRVLDALSGMAGEEGVDTCHFHLLSSAGGLFEGQTCVNACSVPAPLRPYGEAKLRQEEHIQNLEGLRHHIYRPTSVYGFSPEGRIGLIAALLSNMLQGRVTQVSGTAGTVRDFVLAGDIAGHVCDRISAVDAISSVEILASGKPTCLAEISARLQSLSNRPVYLAYQAIPQNSANNSYHPSVLPKSFRPTDLLIGLRQTFEAIHAHYV